MLRGLTAILGPISADPMEGMRREHCNEKDSEDDFTTNNYGVTTTPEKEYWFVADPDNHLKQFGQWPTEKKLVEEKRENECRRAMPLSALKVANANGTKGGREKVDAALREVRHAAGPRQHLCMTNPLT